MTKKCAFEQTPQPTLRFVELLFFDQPPTVRKRCVPYYVQEDDG